MNHGEKMLRLAESRIGERYVNVCVPKNNPDWHGPWDCAEFMSWLVYQAGGFLYGCIDNNGNPATVEAYTGAWQADSKRLGDRVSVAQAAATFGAILLRYPPAPGKMGHIAVSDGKGGTVEAMGRAFGVRRGKVTGRVWDTGVLVPGLNYGAASTATIKTEPPTLIYAMGRPHLKKEVVKDIQRSLKSVGVDPGPIDGIFGHKTTAAVAAYQALKGIIADGHVGPQTARRLRVTLS